jgi:RimJ/RimL family protein N-acetyltransferase
MRRFLSPAQRRGKLRIYATFAILIDIEEELPMTIYETKRLQVRELTAADLPVLKRTLQDEKAMYAYAHAFTDAECRAWLANQQRRYREDGFGLWALIRKADGQFIGQCGLTMQDFDGQQVVEIGYLLQRDYWHQGYAIEAARGAKDYAFTHLHINEVWSIIRDNNLASMNVAIRNGMLVRGEISKHYYGIDMPHFGFAVSKTRVN